MKFLTCPFLVVMWERNKKEKEHGLASRELVRKTNKSLILA